MTTDPDARLEAVTAIMCAAIDRAEAMDCEILRQRYAGMNVMPKTYDRLAELDRQALRTVEAYCRMTQEATRT
jgi:hypothetical protein